VKKGNLEEQPSQKGNMKKKKREPTSEIRKGGLSSTQKLLEGKLASLRKKQKRKPPGEVYRSGGEPPSPAYPRGETDFEEEPVQAQRVPRRKCIFSGDRHGGTRKVFRGGRKKAAQKKGSKTRGGVSAEREGAEKMRKNSYLNRNDFKRKLEGEVKGKGA